MNVIFLVKENDGTVLQTTGLMVNYAATSAQHLVPNHCHSFEKGRTIQR